MHLSSRLTASFLAAEGSLYTAFLTLDILGRNEQTIWLKFSSILLCLAFSLLTSLRGGDPWVAAALSFTAAADVFLLLLDQYYVIGVALFLCVQTLYWIRLRLAHASPGRWLRVILPALFGLGLYLLHLATSLNLLAALYFSQLLSNAALAWTLTGKRWRLFALGLTLFAGCDLSVGLFHSGLLPPTLCSVTLVAMWAFYLPAQTLIVLSALPVKEDPA